VWAWLSLYLYFIIRPVIIKATLFAGYLKQIWRRDDLIVLAHIPETPNLPNVSFKSTLPGSLFLTMRNGISQCEHVSDNCRFIYVCSF